MKDNRMRSENAVDGAARRRLFRIDLIRGFAVLSMILYHAVWDLVYLFQIQWAWFETDWAYFWQQSICITFIAVSGFSAAISRNAAGRGILLLGIGALAGAFTLHFTPKLPLLFGILSLLGTSMLLLSILRPVLLRCRPHIGVITSLLLFAVTKRISEGFLVLPPIFRISLPSVLYRNYVSAFLGFPFPGFTSVDYFPLFPWIFLFFAGFFSFLLLRERDQLAFLMPVTIPAIEKIGRHSLLCYLAHQPILLGMFYLIFQLFFPLFRR